MLFVTRIAVRYLRIVRVRRLYYKSHEERLSCACGEYVVNGHDSARFVEKLILVELRRQSRIVSEFDRRILSVIIPAYYVYGYLSDSDRYYLVFSVAACPNHVIRAGIDRIEY